jgi:integrase/recombinase XerD
MRQYLEWMAVKNYSDKTAANRHVFITAFIAWAEERGIHRPDEVSRPVLERYQRFLYHYRKANGDPMSFRSQYTRLLALRAWFKWLARQNHILYNPASELELPKLEHRLPKHVLTAKEAELIINLTDVNTTLGLRDRALLEVLYSTGVRRTELLSLRLYDFDRDRGTVIVRQGKGKKDRMIPIGDRALAWVERYLADVRPSLLAGDSGDDVLFLTQLGVQFTPHGMTTLVRGYVDHAALGKKGACHLFRHTLATLMLENGADIRFIQQMLGHARLDTTQIYTQVSIKKLKEIHTATHPAKMSREIKPGSKPKAQ